METKARLAAEGLSQVQDADFLRHLHQLPRQRRGKSWRWVQMSMACRSHLGVVQALVCERLGNEIYIKLPGGCGDLSGKNFSLNRSLYGLKQKGRQRVGLLEETVVQYGMEQCKTRPRVFSPGGGRQGRTDYGRSCRIHRDCRVGRKMQRPSMANNIQNPPRTRCRRTDLVHGFRFQNETGNWGRRIFYTGGNY